MDNWPVSKVTIADKRPLPIPLLAALDANFN
jgi:hypothetical protein